MIVDLKRTAGAHLVLELASEADVLIEGFRPGVAERLGIGPDECRERNSRLIYGRVTGWGRTGPLAVAAGHDINYVALSGVLHAIGRSAQPPTPPLSLVGDFGGGGMLLAVGVLAALVERGHSGEGQTVDASMVDGASLLASIFYGLHASGEWVDERGANALDSGAPYYDVYETADGKFISIGSIEPEFFAELASRVGLSDSDAEDREDRERWPALRARLVDTFRTRTRAEWCELLEGTDVCFAPVLSMSEAPTHPQNIARETFVTVDGVVQPAPAPRFSRTPGAIRSGPAPAGRHTLEVLHDWGVPGAIVEQLAADGVIVQRTAKDVAG